MKKNYMLIAFLLLVFSTSTTAQVNYSFSATTATYAAVAGGTTPTLINRPFDYGQYSQSYATGIANNIPIGFTFNYNSVDYTTLNISANGFATLGSPFEEDINVVQHFYINSLEFGPLRYGSDLCSRVPEPGNTKPVLAPLWDDISAGADADLRYITTGAAGSRVFTFEWSKEKWQYDAPATLSFELKLYEGSNVIEFCYKDEGGTPSGSASASIGITASNQTGRGFLSLQNTTASPTISTITETNNLNQKTADDQVYRFTPLLCSIPLNLHYNSYDNTSVSFSWDAPAGVTNFEYAVTTSSAPVSGTATTIISQTISSLNPDTKYYIHVRSYCTISSQSAWFTKSFTTTKNISPPPAIAWQKSLGGSDDDDAYAIEQTSDGGYIVAGRSASNDGDVSGHHGDPYFYDSWIVKLSNSGAIQWQQSLGGDYDENSTDIKQTSDGGYIVAGWKSTGPIAKYWIVKLSNNGATQWEKTLGGSVDDYGYSIAQTSDGGYIVAGAGYSIDGDESGNHGHSDYWIVKLDGNGVIEWQKSVGGSDYEDAPNIKQTSDGGYIVTGRSNSNDGEVSGNHGGYDYWIVKLNNTGIIQWQKSLGGSNDDYAVSIEQTLDGEYIVAGFTNSNDGDVSNSYGSYDYWIVKIGATGTIQWQKSLGGSCSEYYPSIKQTSDAGYIIAGYSGSNDNDINGNHGNGDSWIVKLRNDGTFQWQKCLGGSSGDVARSIELTSDGGYIVAGFSTSNDGDVSGNHGGGDYWIVKLGPDVLLPVTLLNFSGEVRGKQNVLYWTTASEHNNTGFELQRSIDGTNFSKIDFINTKSINGTSNGNLNYDFIDENYSASTNYYRLKQIDKDGKFSYSNIVVLKDNNALTSGLSVYPNPAKNILNVKVASQGNDKITLLVTDLSGKLLINKIMQVSDGENVAKIDITHLHAGTYFLKITSSTVIQNGVRKFVKE